MNKFICGIMVMLVSSYVSFGQTNSSLTVDNLYVSNSATFYGNVKLIGPMPGDVSASALVLSYNFLSNSVPVVLDLSGNGNAASVSGAVWTAAGFTNGGCYSFNGTNQWLETATNMLSLNLTNQLTIQAWIKTSVSANYPMIATKQPSSGAASSQSGNFEFRVNNNGVVYFSSQYSTTASEAVSGVRRVDDNNWHLVGVTVDAASKVVRLYVDGVMDKEQVTANRPIAFATAEPVRIGRRKDGYYFPGLIDEPRIYGRALTPTEMTTTYAYFIQQANAAVLTADRINQTGFQQTNIFMGSVGIGTNTATNALNVAGVVSATKFVGDGSALLNINGGNIANTSIAGAKLANNTITATQIATNGVLVGVNADMVDGKHATDLATASQGARLDLLNSAIAITNGVAIFAEGFDTNWACAPCTNFMMNITNQVSGWVANNVMIMSAVTNPSAPYVCMLKEFSGTNAWVKSPLLPNGYSSIVFGMQATSNNAPITIAVEASYDGLTWITQGAYSNAATNLNWCTFTNLSSGARMYSSQYLRLRKMTESASVGYRVCLDSVTVTAPDPHAVAKELQVTGDTFVSGNLTAGSLTGNGSGISNIQLAALPVQVLTNGGAAAFSSVSGNGAGITNISSTSIVGLGSIASRSVAEFAKMSDIAGRGSVITWGSLGVNSNVPFDASNSVTAVAGGESHSLALRTDGRVVAWGDNTYGACNVPVDASNSVMAIAGGWGYSLALRVDGRVVGWGRSNAPNSVATTIPPDALNSVAAIACGAFHAIALKSDGRVIAWGNSAYGQCNVPVDASNSVVAIAAGQFHSLALRSDGRLVAWGGNNDGACNVPLDASNSVIAIAASVANNNSMALRSDGRVVVWGENSFGHCNVPAAASNSVIAIADGYYHALALRADGSVVTWGDNNNGYLNVPTDAQSSVISIACGSYFSYAIRATKTQGATIVNGDLTVAGKISGNGSGITNISVASLPSQVLTNGGVATFTSLTGNAAGLTALNGAAITTGTVGGVQLAANSITSAHIVDGAVTVNDLASNSVTSAKIVDGTIVAADIANATISGAKLANNTITATQIANNTIGSGQISQNTLLTGVNADMVDGQHATNFALAQQGARLDLLNGAIAITNGVAMFAEGFDTNWACAPCTNFMMNITNLVSGWVANNVMITDAVTNPSAPYVSILKEFSATNAWVQSPLLPNGYSSIVFCMQATSNNAPIVMAVEASYDGLTWITQGAYSNAATNLNWCTFTNLSSGARMYSSQYLRLHKMTESASVGYRVRLDSVTISSPAPHAVINELQVQNVVGPVNFAGATVAGLPASAVTGLGSAAMRNAADFATAAQGAKADAALQPMGNATVQDLFVNGYATVASNLTVNGTITGNGTGLTNINAASLGNVSASDYLKRDGSASVTGSLAMSGITFSNQPGLLNPVTIGLVPGMPVRDLMLYYSFDSDSGTNVWDLSGNGNHGYRIGGVTYEAGRHGLAPRFSSSSTYIVSPANSLNMNGWTGMTVSVWVYPYNLTTYSTILERGGITNSNSGGFLLRTPGFSGYAGSEFWLTTNVTTQARAMITDPARSSLNTWTHYVISCTPTGMNMYINGQLRSQGAINLTSLLEVANTKMVIGNASATPFIGWGDTYLNGRVDELRIYKKTLNDTEIQTLYSNGLCSNGTWQIAPTNAVLQLSGDTLVNGNLIADNLSVNRMSGNGAGITNITGSSIVAGSVASAQLANGSVTTDKLDIVTVDARYVNQTGDTMTGALQLPADGLRVNTHQLIATNGRVGVGTNAPAERLHVNGNVLVETNLTVKGIVAGNGSGLTNITYTSVVGLGSLATRNAEDFVKVGQVSVNGSAMVWGGNTYGQCNVPAAASNAVISLSAGVYYSLALRSDGSVAAWGDNTYGQCNVPAAASNSVTSVSAGNYHGLALRSDGRVVVWGYNDMGQCNVPAAASNSVIAIDGGDRHCLALRADGSVVAWGRNDFGQIVVPASASNSVISVSAGDLHSLALRSDGRVVAWGNNVNGQCNVPATASNSVIAATVGGYHSMALRADGTVITWGDNSYGQCNVPADASSSVIAIAAGCYHSMALRSDGRVVTWGWNNCGQSTVPAIGSNSVIGISGGYYHSLVLRATKMQGSTVINGDLSVAGKIAGNGAGLTNIPGSAIVGGVSGGGLVPANNLSDVPDKAAARANLGIGSAATLASNIFATAVQGAKADTALQPANNLQGLADAAAARVNLGLGSAATAASTAFATAAQGVNADSALQPGANASVNDLSANGNVKVEGQITVAAPAGDLSMGSFTNKP